MSLSSFTVNSTEKRTYKRLSKEGCGLIVTWLENPENFNAYFGAGVRSGINGNVRTKKVVLAELAAYIKENSSNNLDLTSKQVYHRLHYYREKYVAAKNWRETQISAGTTETDKVKGIHTIDRKLDNMCPHFERMDTLFGHRPNFTLLAVHDSTVQEFLDVGGEVGNGGLCNPSENGDDDPYVTQPAAYMPSPFPPAEYISSPTPLISPMSTSSKREAEHNPSASLGGQISPLQSQRISRPSKKRQINPIATELVRTLDWEKEKSTAEFADVLRLKELEIEAKQTENKGKELDRRIKELEIADAKAERKARMFESLIKNGKNSEEIKEFLKLLE